MILDSFRIQGKNALVTGSRRGLGAAIALGLAEAGANVVVHGSQDNGLDEVCAAVRAAGGKDVRAQADLTHPDSCRSLIERTVAELG